jgi:hypothetical protein
MDATSCQPKRITISQRISGNVGPLVSNPDLTKKHKAITHLCSYIMVVSTKKCSLMMGKS